MRCVNEREGTIWQLVTVKYKLTSVFYASDLLLILNFVIISSKQSTDSLGYRIVDPWLPWRCYDEIHDQKQDRCIKTEGNLWNIQRQNCSLSQNVSRLFVTDEGGQQPLKTWLQYRKQLRSDCKKPLRMSFTDRSTGSSIFSHILLGFCFTTICSLCWTSGKIV